MVTYNGINYPFKMSWGGGVKEGIYNNVIEGKNEFRILYIT